MKRTLRRKHKRSRRNTKRRGGVIGRALTKAYPRALGAFYGRTEQTLGQTAEKELEQRMETEFKVQIKERLNDVPEALIKNTDVYKDYERKVITAYNISMVKAGQLIGEHVPLTQQRIKEIVENSLNQELTNNEVTHFVEPLATPTENIAPEPIYE